MGCRSPQNATNENRRLIMNGKSRTPSCRSVFGFVVDLLTSEIRASTAGRRLENQGPRSDGSGCPTKAYVRLQAAEHYWEDDASWPSVREKPGHNIKMILTYRTPVELNTLAKGLFRRREPKRNVRDYREEQQAQSQACHDTLCK